MKIDHLPCDKQIRTVCPMTLSRTDGPYACCEAQCAWWVVYFAGQDEEYGECIINVLVCLVDMVRQ